MRKGVPAIIDGRGHTKGLGCLGLNIDRAGNFSKRLVGFLFLIQRFLQKPRVLFLAEQLGVVRTVP